MQQARFSSLAVFLRRVLFSSMLACPFEIIELLSLVLISLPSLLRTHSAIFLITRWHFND